MKLIHFLKVLQRHILLIILVPLLLASLVFFLTRKQQKKYLSETTIYTGITSGYSVQQEKFDLFVSNATYDNLINLIRARQTLEEVSVCLLVQHLMLDQPDARYISRENWEELKNKIPPEITQIIKREKLKGSKFPRLQYQKTYFNDSVPDNISKLPSSASDTTDSAFDISVSQFLAYSRQGDHNFITDLWNSDDPFYSINAISTININRVQSSDLVNIAYTNPDPGICQNTLVFLTKVAIRNYKMLKQNQTDAVIAYFNKQVENAARRLQKVENDLLLFNSTNNIINYYEQTKAIAGEKEALDVLYQNKQIAFSSADAAIKIIEKKLETHAQLTTNTTTVLRLRSELADVTMQIANIEIDLGNDSATIIQLAGLKAKSENIKSSIKENIDRYYRSISSSEGLPISDLLTAWLSNVIAYEENSAALRVLAERRKQFQKTYEVFAPLGAEMKRFERLIGVTENEYLQLLHDLNLAKLRQQDDELSTNIKLVDQPYYPLKPERSKATIMVLLAGMLGLFLIISILIALEYFDTTIKTPERAKQFIRLKVAGIYPKIKRKSRSVDIGYIIPRVVEMIIQNIKLTLVDSDNNHYKKPFRVLVFTTRDSEGKTTITRELVHKMRSFGEKILYLNYITDRNSINTFPSAAAIPPPSGDELQYAVQDNFVDINDIREILQGYEHIDSNSYDCIFVEIPSIINNSYPIGFIKSFHLALLVVRANRSWTDADILALDLFKEAFPQATLVVLNGVELDYLDSTLGEVPRHRSKFRKALKRILLLQFWGENLI